MVYDTKNSHLHKHRAHTYWKSEKCWKREKFQKSIIYDIHAEVYNDIELFFFSFFLCFLHRSVVPYAKAYSVAVVGAQSIDFHVCVKAALLCSRPDCIFRKRRVENGSRHGQPHTKDSALVTMGWQHYFTVCVWISFEFRAPAQIPFDTKLVLEFHNALIFCAFDRQLLGALFARCVRAHTTGVETSFGTKVNRWRGDIAFVRSVFVSN